MAIKFSQFVVETSASTMSHIVGYDGADNIQITPNNFFTSFVTGTTGQVPFFGSTTSLQGDSSFNWDDTNKRLGIGTTNPIEKLQVVGQLISSGSSSTSATTGVERAIMDLSIYSATDHSARFGHFRGVESAGAGQLRLYTDSVERLRIDASGNVGIGTTSPGTTLDVAGTLASSGITQLGTGGSNVLLTSTGAGSVGIGTSSPVKKLDVEGSIRARNGAGTNAAEIDVTSGSTWRLRSNPVSGTNNYGFEIIKGSAGTDIKLAINSSGNVGIGTSSPSSTLTLGNATDNVAELRVLRSNGSSSTYASVNTIGGTGQFGSSGSTRVYSTGNEKLNLRTNGSDRLTILSGGNVGIGTSSPSYPLDIVGFANSSSGFRVTDGTIDNRISWSSGNVGFFGTISNHPIAFNTNSIERMRIDSSGNVGIGTPNPAGKLHVKDVGAIYTSLSGSDSTVNFIENGGNPWRIGNRSSDDSFRFSQSSSSLGTNVRVTFADGGNVGIGTSSPSVKTHIQGGNAVTGAFYDGSTVLAVEDTNPYMQIIGTDGGNQASSLILTTVPAAGTGNNKHWAVQHRGTTQNGNFGISYDTTSASGQDGADGTDLFVINTTGNVGIGTTSPTARLNVKSSGSNLDEISLTHSGNTVNIASLGQESGHGSLVLRNNSGAIQTRLSAGGNNSYILNSNVGIGTSSPAANLHIQDSAGANIILNSNTASAGGGIYMTEGSAGTPLTTGTHVYYDGSSNLFKIDTGTSSLTTRFVITRDTGNVGIGTTAPTAKLTVVGLAEYADNAAAISAGLTTGAFYRTGDLLKVVH